MGDDRPEGGAVLQRFLLASLAVAAVASADLTLSFADNGAAILSWMQSDTVFDHLELRVSMSPFEDGDVGKGSVLRKILPERDGSMPTSIEIPGSFVVDPEVCIGCGLCISRCPVGAIELVDGAAVIDPDKCIACGLCVASCPVGAIFSPTSEGPHFALVGVTADGRRTMLEIY